MAKRDRRTSFGAVIPTQQELQQAEEKRIEIEEAEEQEASLKEIRNTTFLIDKELSKKLRVHCLDKNISVSLMLNSFVDSILSEGLEDNFSSTKINSTSRADHKVTYYIQRGALNELRALSITNETTIREILTYYILKELDMLVKR